MPSSTYTGSKGQVAGNGSVISIGGYTGSTSESFVTIGEVKDASRTGLKRGVVEVTSFGSGNRARKLATVLDEGQVEFTVARIANDSGQLALLAAAYAEPPVAYDFEVQLPVNPKAGQTSVGDLYAFSALITVPGTFDISLTKESDVAAGLRAISDMRSAQASVSRTLEIWDSLIPCVSSEDRCLLEISGQIRLLCAMWHKEDALFFRQFDGSSDPIAKIALAGDHAALMESRAAKLRHLVDEGSRLIALNHSREDHVQ
jgi:hypothetical protein